MKYSACTNLPAVVNNIGLPMRRVFLLTNLVDNC